MSKNGSLKAENYAQFDLNDPQLPDWIDEGAHKSGGYPYDKRMKNGIYLAELHSLHIELAKFQRHVK